MPHLIGRSSASISSSWEDSVLGASRGSSGSQRKLRGSSQSTPVLLHQHHQASVDSLDRFLSDSSRVAAAAPLWAAAGSFGSAGAGPLVMSSTSGSFSSTASQARTELASSHGSSESGVDQRSLHDFFSAPSTLGRLGGANLQPAGCYARTTAYPSAVGTEAALQTWLKLGNVWSARPDEAWRKEPMMDRGFMHPSTPFQKQADAAHRMCVPMFVSGTMKKAAA
jgi:hypothetical protein